MLKITLLILALTYHASSHCCQDGIEDAFNEYQSTLLSGKSVSKFFSRGFLVDSLNSIYLLKDTESILHNVNAIGKWLFIGHNVDVIQRLSTDCKTNILSIIGKKNNKPIAIRLTYILEPSGLKIDATELDITKQQLQ